MDLMTVDSGTCPCGKRLNWWARKGRGPWIYEFRFYCSEDCALAAAAADG